MEHVKENTSLYWALRIKDPTIRDNLVRALKEQKKENVQMPALKIGSMMTWDATTEGHKYWSKLSNGPALELLDTPYTQSSGKESYSVGDWIVIIHGGAGGWVGDVVQIREVQKHDVKGGWRYKTDKYTLSSSYPIETRIRKATAAEIATVVKDEWCVGDKLPVDWLNSVDTYGALRGAKMISSTYSGNRKINKVEEGWGRISDACNCWLKPKSNYPTYPDTTVEKKAEPVVPERMYKVGDRVKIIKDDTGKLLGQCGTVYEVGTMGLYWVNMDSGDNEILFSGEAGTSKQLELYTEPVPEKWSIVTTDGVKVYEDNDTWWLTEDGTTHLCTKENPSTTRNRVGIEANIQYGLLLFSTYEKAEEYRKKQCGETTDVQWKAGDWVEVLDTANVRKFNSDAIGYRFQLETTAVESLNKGESCVEQPVQKYGVNYMPGSLKKVDGPHPTVTSTPTKAPTMEQKYEVGQRVVVHSGANTGNEYNGWRGEITAIDKSHLYQPCISVKFETGAEVWCYPNDRRIFNVEILSDKIPTPPIPVERKWQIGSKFKHRDGNPVVYTVEGTMEAPVVSWAYPTEGKLDYKPEVIDQVIQRGDWIPYTPEPTMVTLDNVYIGMKVVRGRDWNYWDQDGEAGNVGVVLEDTTMENWVKVQWGNGIKNSYRVGYNESYDLYVAPGETITNTNKQSNQVTTNQSKTQTNDKQINSTQHQDSSKCTISNRSTGTALDLRDDQERVITGSRRPGNSLRCDGQPELTAGKHSRHTKGVGYCEKV